MNLIPVFEPYIGDDEINAVVAALERGEISGTFGTAISEFEQAFAEYCGCKFGVSVTSGTTALHLAVASININPGDEVLLSTSTNIATALAVVHNRGIPVPIDSEEITWNLDLDMIEQFVTPKTRAIIPVHLFGHPVDMDKLMQIADKYNLVVIEDCAESHGAECRGRRTGGIGDIGCFSFYANKIITTGEGGMVVTNDQAIADNLRKLRNMGVTDKRFQHDVLAYNFRMTGYQAAMGLAQLQKIDSIIREKKRVAKTYHKLLGDIPGIQLPQEEPWASSVYWMFAIVVKPEFGISRDKLAAILLEKGIETREFFYPMDQQPCLMEITGFHDITCPVAYKLWETGLYLPSSPTLPDKKIEFITETIREIQNQAVV